MLLPLLCVVFFVFGRLGAVELIMGQVHAGMMATALDHGAMLRARQLFDLRP